MKDRENMASQEGKGLDFADKPGLKPPGDHPDPHPGIWDTRKEDGRAGASRVPTPDDPEVSDEQDPDAGQGSSDSMNRQTRNPE